MGLQGNAAWQKMRQNWDKSVPAGAAGAAAVGGAAAEAMWAEGPAAGQHLYGGRDDRLAPPPGRQSHAGNKWSSNTLVWRTWLELLQGDTGGLGPWVGRIRF